MVLHFGQFAPPHDCCRRCAVDIGGLKKKQTGTYVHFLGQIFVYSAIYVYTVCTYTKYKWHRTHGIARIITIHNIDMHRGIGISCVMWRADCRPSNSTDNDGGLAMRFWFGGHDHGKTMVKPMIFPPFCGDFSGRQRRNQWSPSASPGCRFRPTGAEICRLWLFGWTF